MKVTSAIVFLATLAPTHAYLQQMTPAVKKSFAPGQGIKHAPVAGNGMGGFAPGTLAAPPATVEAEIVAAAAPSTADYFSSMQGAAAPVKKANFGPASGKKYAATSGSGLGFAPGTLAAPPQHAAADVIPSDYLNRGEAAPVKKGNFAPGQGKKHAPVAGTGIGGFTPGAPIDGMAPIGIAAPNSADYMAQMGGGFASVKKSSFGPGSHYAPSGGTAGGAADVAHSNAEYMERMGGGTAPVKAATYGLGNGKIYSSSSTGIGFSHLESFGVPTEEKATFGGIQNSNNAVLDAISSMNNDMITHQQATIEVLKDISAGVKSLVSKMAAKSSWQ